MDNIFDSDISIELLSAYLDGNLDAETNAFVEQNIEDSNSLHDFVSLANTLNDENFDLDIHVPDEILSQEFDLPTIPYTDGFEESGIIDSTDTPLDIIQNDGIYDDNTISDSFEGNTDIPNDTTSIDTGIDFNN